jgi:hypothetical protein
MNPSTCLFANLVLASCRDADTGVLSLAPLKRVALNARAAPLEPHSQPLHAEPLLVQVEEGWSCPSRWRSRPHRPRRL